MKKSPSRPRVLVAFAGLALASVALSGCAGGTADLLSTIEERGKINVGVCLSVPPYGMISSSGEPDGFDVEVARQFADELGVEVNLVDVNVASRIPSLQSGTLDLISCNFTITEERAQQVDFSDTMMFSGNSLLVKKDSDITSLADLAGRTVAVSKGGTSIPVTTEHAPDAVQQPYETFASAVLALQQGQADAVIDISTSVTDAATKNTDLRIAVDGEVGPKVEFGLAVPKDQTAYLERVNEFVASFHAAGTGSELFEKWAGAPATFQFVGLED